MLGLDLFPFKGKLLHLKDILELQDKQIQYLTDCRSKQDRNILILYFFSALNALSLICNIVSKYL